MIGTVSWAGSDGCECIIYSVWDKSMVFFCLLHYAYTNFRMVSMTLKWGNRESSGLTDDMENQGIEMSA